MNEVKQQVRFNGHRFINCRWCQGRSCLYCKSEADKVDRAKSPKDPQPIATFKLNNPADLERARQLIGPEALKKHFGPGGGGMEAFEESLRNSLSVDVSAEGEG